MSDQPNQPAVRLRGVGKRYHVVTEGSGAFSRYVMSQAHRALHQRDLWAVRDVTLDIPKGALVGVIGPNGAGKSTLLKLIAGITESTEGTVEVNGRVVPMLEVSVGFHPELTGYENAFLHGSILGMSDEVVRHRLGAVIAFAELEEFMDMPIKHYSSGMKARLGFALSVHSDAEIILVDETLAVGDVQFQSKCLQAMSDLHRRGKTVLFVTHNIRFARLVCDEAMWIDHGRVIEHGDRGKVISSYLRHLNMKMEGELENGGDDKDAGVRITGVRTLDESGQPKTDYRYGDPLIVEVKGVADREQIDPDLRLTILREDYEIVAVESARASGCEHDRVSGEFRWTVKWPDVWLNTADYLIGAALLAEGKLVARRPEAVRVHITSDEIVEELALAAPPCEFSVTPE